MRVWGVKLFYFMVCRAVRKLLISITKCHLSSLLSSCSHVFLILTGLQCRGETWLTVTQWWPRWVISLHQGWSDWAEVTPGATTVTTATTWLMITTWPPTPQLRSCTLAGDLISHRRPRWPSLYWHVWGEVRGGWSEVEWHRRKHHFFLAQLQSAAKHPGGLAGTKYRAGLGQRKY